jgi:urate oxidase
MTYRIQHHDYGKARVRLVRVRRRGEIHDLRELTVRVMLEGAFEGTYLTGDNASVLPTDTMKNTVYGLAKEKGVERLETFGLDLAAHFLATHAPTSRAIIDLEEPDWVRIMAPGARGLEPHPHAFRLAGTEVWTATIRAERGAETIESGLRGLRLLKTTASGFEGYPRDRFTTLKETRDRIFASEIEAVWTWRERPKDFAVENDRAREALMQTFAAAYSPSVQFTLHEMAKAVLDRCPAIGTVRLSMPNLHCLPVDLSPFGLQNDGEIFVPTSEPHGLIEATVSRE